MTTAPLDPDFRGYAGEGYVLDCGVPEGARITEVSPASEAAVEAWLDDLEADIAAQIAAEGSSPVVLMRGRMRSPSAGLSTGGDAAAVSPAGVGGPGVGRHGVGGVALQLTTLLALVDWLAGIVEDPPTEEPASPGTSSSFGTDSSPAAPCGDAAGHGVAVAGVVASPAELIELLSGLEQIKGAVAAAQARVTAAFARAATRGALAGHTSVRQARASVAPQVALARRCSPASADRLVGLARALPTMPRTRAALTAGEIDERSALGIVRETACLSVADRARVDDLLAPRLGTDSFRALTGAAARLAAELDPGSVVAKHEKALGERGVWTRPAPDGMAYLTILGSLPGIVGAFASVSRYANAVLAGHTGGDDPVAGRTHPQVMADTAQRWLAGLTPGQAQPVALKLVMPYEALFTDAEPEPDPGQPVNLFV